MNDDRIRRALRRPGPREPRIQPASLPPDIHAARAMARDLQRRDRGGVILRAAGGFALAAVAVVLATLVGIQLLGGSAAPTGSGIGDASRQPASPTPAASTASTPASTPVTSATATPSATLARCSAASLSATSAPWGAAAGSRGTTVTITNTGANACTLRGSPGAALTDAGGATLAIVGESASASDPVLTLQPGSSLTTDIVWGNWCAAAPAQPIAASLVVDGTSVPVAPAVTGSEVAVPPCMGTGGVGQTSLSTITYQAAP
jgi:hypothetical protein